MDGFYGSLDLTKLGVIVRHHPELIKKVQFKDGSTHQMLNININQKYHEDAYGNVAYMKAAVKRAEEKNGVSYFLGELKKSKFDASNSQKINPQAQQTPPVEDNGDLPF